MEKMLKTNLYDRQKMLNVLVAASLFMGICIVVTLYTENAKFMGLGMLVWISSVFWNMRLMFLGSNLTVGDFVEHVHRRELDAKNNKKHIERGVYSVVIPLMGVGLIFMVLILIAFFTIL
jgi:hypothetical protein